MALKSQKFVTTESLGTMSIKKMNISYSMVLQMIRTDILRVEWYFSESRRGEEKYKQ